jgi:tetratricopeptide (TPR) repeat protein
VPREPNLRLRDTIAAANLTYDNLARDVRRVARENGEILQTNKSAVAHWVNGTEPSARTASYICEALSRRAGLIITHADIGLAAPSGPGSAVAGDPVAASAELGRADVENRRFLAIAVFTASGAAMPLRHAPEEVSRMLRVRTSTRRAGAADVEVIRNVTTAFAFADERLGGGHGLTTVAAYLADTAAPLLRARFLSEAVRRDAFGAAAELAYLAGFKHHDLGQDGAAQRYYQAAFQLASESDPHGHAAWMMRVLAHQALSLGQPAYCTELAQAAVSRGSGRVDGRTEALLYVTLARAHATAGERRAAARALAQSENSLARRDEPQSRFSLISGPAEGTIASHTARTLTILADHAGTEKQHRAALVSWDRRAYPRVHALTHADLGDSLAAQARADEAIAAWTRALDLMDGMASDRAGKAMTAVLPALASYRRRKVPGAADLAHRIRERLA